MFFFFFKQKTAYEMRISDWSSDVCSSDLEHLALQPDCARLARPFAARPDSAQWHRIETLAHWLREVTAANARDPLVIRIVELLLLAVVASPEVEAADAGERSEEHTSELQSLMRISYAVFCLKKKIQNKEP